MIYLLILFPLAMAAVAFAMPSNHRRPWLLPLGGLVQLVLAMLAIFPSPEWPPAVAPLLTVAPAMDNWLLLDTLGKLVLGFLSV